MIVAVACEDAGGARALAPVVRALRARGDVARLTVGPAAARIFQEAGLAHGLAADAVELDDADCLLCASTCWGTRLEAHAVLAARQRSLPTLTMIDFWSNYRSRLSYPSDSGLALVSDVVLAIDESMRRGLVESGVSDACIRTTGSPSFDELWTKPTPDVPVVPTVLFLSQPISSLYGADPHGSTWLGYTERSVLQMVAAAVSRRRGVRLIVRPHPREDAAALRGLIAELGTDAELFSDGTLDDALAATTVATGMTSMALVEAALAGIPALSIQPGCRDHDQLPTNGHGLTSPVYEVEVLDSAIAAALSATREPPERRLAKLGWAPGATARVVRAVDELVISPV